MLESVVPMTAKNGSMGSQNFVYVATDCNPITSACVDVLKDDRSKFAD